MPGPGNQISPSAVDPYYSDYTNSHRDFYRKAFATKKTTTKTSTGSSTQTQTQTNTGGGTGAGGGGVWGQNPASSTPCDIPGQSCPQIGALGGTANWCKCVAGGGGGGTTADTSGGGGGGGGSGILGSLFNAFCGNCGGSGTAAAQTPPTTTTGNGTTTTGTASAASDTGGCSLTAFVDKGNSPGWYTAGANASGGAGWGGAPGHHHCDWKSPCCFCTDPPKCKRSGTPPTAPGSCRPDWGTSGYLGQGQYPANPNFSACPPGTAPTGAALARAYATKKKTSTKTPTTTTTTTTPADTTTAAATPTTPAPAAPAAPSRPCIPFICDSQSHFNVVIIILVVILLLFMFKVIR